MGCGARARAAGRTAAARRHPRPPPHGGPPVNVLSLCCLSVHHADRVLVGPVTLHLPAGQTLGIRGPSGVGKSTLLRAAVGLLP
ncbi:MAG: ATP-binding cassette domain-containing protein, partial [Pseudonocardiaceae bacterium]